MDKWIRGSREKSLGGAEKLRINTFQLGSSGGGRPVKGVTQMGGNSALQRAPGATEFEGGTHSAASASWYLCFVSFVLKAMVLRRHRDLGGRARPGL